MQLGAGAAGPGVSHGPEVVLRAQAVDPLRGNADEIPPEAVSLIVVFVDRGDEPPGLEAVHFRAQIPGEPDGLPLEVISEREVPQHLEEGVVQGRSPDGVQIVVLAAHPHAFLAGGCALVIPLFQPQKNVLELIHPGVGKEQGRVVSRNQGTALDNAMALFPEEFQKGAADFRGCHHGFSLRSTGAVRRDRRGVPGRTPSPSSTGREPCASVERPGYAPTCASW